MILADRYWKYLDMGGGGSWCSTCHPYWCWCGNAWNHTEKGRSGGRKRDPMFGNPEVRLPIEAGWTDDPLPRGSTYFPRDGRLRSALFPEEKKADLPREEYLREPRVGRIPRFFPWRAAVERQKAIREREAELLYERMKLRDEEEYARLESGEKPRRARAFKPPPVLIHAIDPKVCQHRNVFRYRGDAGAQVMLRRRRAWWICGACGTLVPGPFVTDYRGDLDPERR